jgi:ketosteroid isomerase-like protein
MTATSADPTTSPNVSRFVELEVRRWLDRFAAAVRAVDYDSARAMFDEDVVGFGTFARMLVGRENLIAGQWKNIWGCTRGFRFLMDEAHISVSGELAWVATPWISQGRDEHGKWFDRHGRSTLILRQRGDGKWLCVHSHYSRQPTPNRAAGDATPA